MRSKESVVRIRKQAVKVNLEKLATRFDDCPFHWLDLKKNRNWNKVRPLKTFKDEWARGFNYDAPRVKHFKNIYEGPTGGRLVEPVLIKVRDNGEVLIWNGFHRVCGAMLAGVKTIRVTPYRDLQTEEEKAPYQKLFAEIAVPKRKKKKND